MCFLDSNLNDSNVAETNDSLTRSTPVACLCTGQDLVMPKKAKRPDMSLSMMHNHASLHFHTIQCIVIPIPILTPPSKCKCTSFHRPIHPPVTSSLSYRLTVSIIPRPLCHGLELLSCLNRDCGCCCRFECADPVRGDPSPPPPLLYPE